MHNFAMLAKELIPENKRQKTDEESPSGGVSVIPSAIPVVSVAPSPNIFPPFSVDSGNGQLSGMMKEYPPDPAREPSPTFPIVLSEDVPSNEVPSMEIPVSQDTLLAADSLHSPSIPSARSLRVASLVSEIMNLDADRDDLGQLETSAQYATVSSRLLSAFNDFHHLAEHTDEAFKAHLWREKRLRAEDAKTSLQEKIKLETDLEKCRADMEGLKEREREASEQKTNLQSELESEKQGVVALKRRLKEKETELERERDALKEERKKIEALEQETSQFPTKISWWKDMTARAFVAAFLEFYGEFNPDVMQPYVVKHMDQIDESNP